MDQPNSEKGTALRYSLSALNDQITELSSSKSISDVAKKNSKVSQTVIRNNRIKISEINSNNLSDDIPWFQKYEPNTLVEVAIHKRKLSDVRSALEAMLSEKDHNKVLLLTGPSGCSKSTVIHKLADELVPLYRKSGSMLTLRQNHQKEHNVIEYHNDTIINGLNHMDSFREFLREAKYKIGSNLSIILVEDFPNVFHNETRRVFQTVLLEWLSGQEDNLPPLVLCLTECEIENDGSRFNAFNIDNIYTAETVLNRELLNHPKLQTIKFNPINMSLMKKVLNNIALKEHELLEDNGKWKLKSGVIDEISKSSGDIRSGIYAFEWWAKSHSDLKFITRKESTSYFHAVGKLIHGSKDIEDDNEMINNLIESTNGLLSNDNFKLGLLENYSSFDKGNFDIKSATDIIDALGESDIMGSSPESLEYSARKVRYTFNQLKGEDHHHGKSNFPVDWKIQRLMNEFKIQSDDYFNVSLYKYNTVPLMKDIVLDYSFYSPFIRGLRNYKKKVLVHYSDTLRDPEKKKLRLQYKETFEIDENIDILNRIGGNIASINSDQSIVASDDNETDTKKSVEKYQIDKNSKLKKLIQQKQQDELGLDEGDFNDEDKAMLNDNIIDSDDENIDDDDDSFYEIVSQKKLEVKQELKPDIDESLSDSDLEMF